jgi:hypothetical protein
VPITTRSGVPVTHPLCIYSLIFHRSIFTRVLPFDSYGPGLHAVLQLIFTLIRSIASTSAAISTSSCPGIHDILVILNDGHQSRITDSYKSWITDGYKPDYRWPQAGLPTATSRITDGHKPDYRRPQAGLPTATSRITDSYESWIINGHKPDY